MFAWRPSELNVKLPGTFFQIMCSCTQMQIANLFSILCRLSFGLISAARQLMTCFDL